MGGQAARLVDGPHGLEHEQRVAPGEAAEGLGQGLEVGAAERQQQAPHPVGGEGVEVEAHGRLALEQGPDLRLDRRLELPPAVDEHRPQPALQHPVEPVDGGLEAGEVGVVQVVEDQRAQPGPGPAHQLGAGLEEAQLALLALDALQGQGLGLELGQDARELAAHPQRQQRAGVALEQAAQQAGQGGVGDVGVGGEGLGAGKSPHPGRELARQAGLAHPRLAGDEDQLPGIPRRLEGLQLPLPPHQHPGPGAHVAQGARAGLGAARAQQGPHQQLGLEGGLHPDLAPQQVAQRLVGLQRLAPVARAQVEGDELAVRGLVEGLELDAARGALQRLVQLARLGLGRGQALEHLGHLLPQRLPPQGHPVLEVRGVGEPQPLEEFPPPQRDHGLEALEQGGVALGQAQHGLELGQVEPQRLLGGEGDPVGVRAQRLEPGRPQRLVELGQEVAQRGAAGGPVARGPQQLGEVLARLRPPLHRQVGQQGHGLARQQAQTHPPGPKLGPAEEGDLEGSWSGTAFRRHCAGPPVGDMAGGLDAPLILR